MTTPKAWQRGLSMFLAIAIASPAGQVAFAADVAPDPGGAADVAPDPGAEPEPEPGSDPGPEPEGLDPRHSAASVQRLRSGDDEPPPGAAPPTLAAAPTSTGSKSAATTQAVPLPRAEGSVEGMGESFSPDLGSGAATYTVPLKVPPGRGGIEPSLALAYSSTSGNGVVGLGWSIGAPFISRQSDRGMPRYVDRATWHAEEDRFFYNGGQELVPVDGASIELADCGAPGCAPVPAELAGWQQYRARVESGFMRFFRAPDSRRWVVQSPDGARYDFGALPAGDGPAEAVARSSSALVSEQAGGQGRVYRWMVTRVSDAHGSPAYYLYDEHGGERHLADVFYTSPNGACAGLGSVAGRRACAAPLADYGRRVRLVYEPRPDPLTSYTSGWEMRTGVRLRRLEMTSAEGAPGVRTLVRRYHLAYEPSSYWSLLASVELEGRPASVSPITGAVVGNPHVAEASLGNAYVGKRLTPMRFTYSTQPMSLPFAPGFGGVDATVHTSPASPPYSVGANADLFDVNTDGLPDLVVTDPGTFHTPAGGPATGVYFNGFTGAGAAPGAAGGFSAAVPVGVRSDLGGVMRLSNANVSPMDVDGDGRGDYLHLPRAIDTGYFTPVRAPGGALSPAQQGWRWAYLPRPMSAADPDPLVDFAHDGDRLRQFDVNRDSLVDIVRTTGTSMQVWLNLGWLPGGDGRYGHATFGPGQAGWTLSTTPIETCLPVVGAPLDFADPEVHLGDMNGDGITDIVKVRKGRVLYWVGRGEGAFGSGAADCPAGLVQGRHVEMATPPAEIDPELSSVYLADVNADGVDDVLQVRFNDVDVWFNRGGQGFAPRVRLADTPYAPAFDTRVRLADVDGSGTVDVLYARADGWRWVDPMGGQRPRLLTRVDGAMGGRTELAYRSSVVDYLADLGAASSCTGASCERHVWGAEVTGCDAKVLLATGSCATRSGGSPVLSTVVAQVESSDRLDTLGLVASRQTTRFRYHDGYYEGIEQEFRGFGAAESILDGDANQPTAIERVTLHQGRRAQAIASDRLADNPDEALKGAVFLTETLDEGGRYLSSSHSTYTSRRLAVGLSGVAVVHAYVSQTDELRYDVSPFVPSSANLVVPGVVRPDGGAESHALRVRGAGWAQLRSTVEQVDGLGQVLGATRHGRVRGELGEAIPDERIVTHASYANVAGNEAGWLWRSSHGWVDGHGDATRLGETTRSYSSTGDLTHVVTAVSQPIVPSFGGDAEAEGFGAPLLAPLGTSTTHDVWGNQRTSCTGGDAASMTGCLRLSRIDHDDDYALVPARQHVATAPLGSGFAWLTTSGTWDRGFLAVTESLDANGESTRTFRDGFGRATASRSPDVAGCSASWPSVRLEYADATAATPVTSVRVLSFLSCTDATRVLESWAYTDGLGRVRASLSRGHDDAAQRWVKLGHHELNRRGSPRRGYQPSYFGGDPDDLGSALARPQLTASTQVTYDAFGRVVTTVAEDGATTLYVHHALSSDVYDPLDLASGSAFQGTPATTRQDGHGRVIDQVLRNRQPGQTAGEVHRLFTRYRADGAIVRLDRAQTSTDAPGAGVVGGRQVGRTFFYDSVGRRLSSTNPDTDDPATGAGWRYLFNRASDLVAIRDPRGCGQNFYYDLAGRPLAEAYVGCAEAQVQEAPVATLAWGIGLGERTGPLVDVLMVYDGYQGSWAPAPQGLTDHPLAPGGLSGRLAAAIDRGRRSVYAYDRRGNAVWEARQLSVVPAPGPSADAFASPPPAVAPSSDVEPDRTVVWDEQHTYTRSSHFDHGNRPRAKVLPRDPDFAGGPGPRVVGTLDYDRRGLPRSTQLQLVTGGGVATVIDGAVTWPGASVVTRPIVASMEYTRDGLPSRTVLGDDLFGARSPTVITTDYDIRRRPSYSQTVRAATAVALPGERPLGAVTVVQAQGFQWDVASNLTAIDDLRLPEEWPDGLRPQFRTISHDALYRVVGVEYEYAQEGGARGADDLGTDWRAEQLRVRAADPMLQEPAPMLASAPPGRVVSQTWQFDWLGNMTEWGDDAHAFYERSLGAIDSGADLGAGRRPSALYLAADLGGPPSDRGGWVEVDYGVSGNVVALTAHAQCTDAAPQVCADPGGALDARRAALRAGCACASEQYHQYRWDELDRLVEARRHDRAGATGSYDVAVRQRYRYDAGNARTAKVTADVDGPEVTALYVFPGDFERRGLVRSAGAYVADPGVRDTQSEYVVSGARVVWQAGDAALGIDADHRLSYALSDLLGSTSAVIDLRSGALTQVGSFYPNGGQETLAGTTETLVPFEPEGFTGKEHDEEVGLVYFGERYLIPALARWASPDPMAVHALGGGEVLNSYHYVAGNLLQATDPLGLEPVTKHEDIDLSEQYWEEHLQEEQNTHGAKKAKSLAERGWELVLGEDGQPIFKDDPREQGVEVGTKGQYVFSVKIRNEKLMEEAWFAFYGDTGLAPLPVKKEPSIWERGWDLVHDGLDIASIFCKWCSLGSAAMTAAEGDIKGAIIQIGIDWIGGKVFGKADDAADAAKKVKKSLGSTVKWKGFSKGELEEHWVKHGGEFGGQIGRSDYLKMAKTFASESGDFLEQKVGGILVKYDPATRRTAIAHLKDREIRSFYIADYRDADPFAAAVTKAKEITKTK